VPAGRAEARRSHLFASSPYLFLVLSTAVRLAAGLVLLKYLAWQFRPSIFGLLTQVMAVAAVFYLFAGGGITSGIIRNISAAQSQDEQRRWMSAANTITLLSSIVLAAVALVLALRQQCNFR
jgi:O-antigen/teichoic acid export membrane protein